MPSTWTHGPGQEETPLPLTCILPKRLGQTHGEGQQGTLPTSANPTRKSMKSLPTDSREIHHWSDLAPMLTSTAGRLTDSLAYLLARLVLSVTVSPFLLHLRLPHISTIPNHSHKSSTDPRTGLTLVRMQTCSPSLTSIPTIRPRHRPYPVGRMRERMRKFIAMAGEGEAVPFPVDSPCLELVYHYTDVRLSKKIYPITSPNLLRRQTALRISPLEEADRFDDSYQRTLST
jgi:hypothetical protein